jgi:uncharacterized membrane protein
MFTIIGGDGREYGPVSVEQVRSWLAAGRANLATQAKRIGEDAWRPLGEFAEFSVSASHEPPPLEEPEVMTGPIDAKTYANALIARAAPLDPFDCFDRSWRLLKGNFWPLFGITLLVLFLSWLVSWLAGHLPRPRFYFGEVQIFGPENLANFLLGGVFTGGLYYYYLKKLRGRPTQISDAFHGFTAAFLPLLLLGIVSSFFITIGIICLILPGIYLAVAYSFAQLLIVDKQLPFGQAMSISRRVISAQWWRMFGLLLLAGLVAALGLIGFVVGILVTLPIAFGAVVCAYEALCNPPRRPMPANPATPVQ